MRSIFLILCFFVNICYSLEVAPIPEQPDEVTSGAYLSAGLALKVAFDEIEERFPEYNRLGKDIQELEASEQILLESGMDIFEYETELMNLRVTKQRIYDIVIDQEIKKIDMIQVLISQIEGLKDSQARVILENMGFEV